MIQEFARVLREQIRKDMNNYADDLSSGQCRTFDEYQKLCGVIQGLAIAERYLLDLAKKVEDSDE
jgi:hypothetical protein